MSFLRKKLFKKKTSEKPVIIVSGLPRSGTSMMMRMLEAGGIKVVTDNFRKADLDNPKGYYEFEKVKKIKEDASWIDACRGKVVKMVSMLLYDLPDDRTYKVVFMKRKMEEILQSQQKMLDRLKKESVDSDQKMAERYEKHLKEIDNWLEKKSNIEVLYVHYNEVIEDPQRNIERLNVFFENTLQIDNMKSVIDRNLYRQRK